MGNLQFKRGLKNNLPTSAASGTPLWCTDTKELFIGTGNSVAQITTSSNSEGLSITYDAVNKMLILNKEV